MSKTRRYEDEQEGDNQQRSHEHRGEEIVDDLQGGVSGSWLKIKRSLRAMIHRHHSHNKEDTIMMENYDVITNLLLPVQTTGNSFRKQQ